MHEPYAVDGGHEYGGFELLVQLILVPAALMPLPVTSYAVNSSFNVSRTWVTNSKKRSLSRVSKVRG